jgi:hypothetical protein
MAHMARHRPKLPYMIAGRWHAICIPGGRRQGGRRHAGTRRASIERAQAMPKLTPGEAFSVRHR